MTNKELNLKLINDFPDLYEVYKSETEWQEGDNTGSHTVYGDVLAPYFRDCVSKKNYSEVKKILDFLEEILLCHDKYADEAVVFSVLEGMEETLINDRNLACLVGKTTKSMLIQLSKYKREAGYRWQNGQ